MLWPRLIPCLLLSGSELVKTIQFSSDSYIGDPINAVRIFNEKEVDELIVIDIDATKKGVEPSFDLIERISAECEMPLCYAGGVKDSQTVERLISLGVEKVAIGHHFDKGSDWVSGAAKRVGRQSLTHIINAKWNACLNTYEVVGVIDTNKRIALVDVLKRLNTENIGEILLHAVDRDGCMSGYDLNLFQFVRSQSQLRCR